MTHPQLEQKNSGLPRVGPSQALAGADLMMRAETALVAGRARTIVRLLRYGVESAADAYWENTRPGEVVGQRFKRGVQLRLLAAKLDRPVAHEIYATWCNLSDAAKPHPYELAPSLEELRTLQAAALRAVAALEVDP